MYKNIFDSHAHYDSDCFIDNVDEILKEQIQNGVKYIANIGSSLETSKTTAKLAEKYSFIYGAVGVHPDDALSVDDNCLLELEKLAKLNKIRAIGEIGVDYYYETIPREEQIKAFEKQLGLAKELNMPVIIHTRDAFDDTLKILKKYKPQGVVHCYSGSKEIAKEILKLDMYIGFTGVLTFKKAKKAVESAKEIPMDKLLLETDCPYMAPEPFRGKTSVSSMIAYTAEKLGEIKGLDTQAVLDITCKNAMNFYGINE